MSDEPNSQRPEVDEATLQAGYMDDLRKQFIMLPMTVFTIVEKGKLRPTDACVYAYCLAKAGEKGYLWWSNEKLALLTRFDVSTVKASLTRLEQAGYIRRVTMQVGDQMRRYIYPLLWVDETGSIVFGRSKADKATAPVANVQTVPFKQAA